MVKVARTTFAKGVRAPTSAARAVRPVAITTRDLLKDPDRQPDLCLLDNLPNDPEAT
jgi:hypothetical protein